MLSHTALALSCKFLLWPHFLLSISVRVHLSNRQSIVSFMLPPLMYTIQVQFVCLFVNADTHECHSKHFIKLLYLTL